MVFVLGIGLCVTLLIYYFIYKKWSNAVKIVGRSILDVVKPLYKFLFRVFPITVVLVTVMSIVLTVALVVSAVQGSSENNDNGENVESVEEIKYDDMSFVEKFVYRAGNRTVGFIDELGKKLDSFNKFIGIDEKEQDEETTEFGIKYILLVAYGMSILILWPFILILLIIVITFVLILELLVGMFVMDIVILIIRLVLADNSMEKIKYWWQWAKK